MKLTLNERLCVLQILPVTGNFKHLTVVKSLVDRVKFTDDEEKKYGIVRSERGISIPPEHDKVEVEYEFSKEENKKIVDILAGMEKEEKISLWNMSIYDKFIEQSSKQK